MDCTHCNQIELKEKIDKVSHAWNDLLLGVPNKPMGEFQRQVIQAIIKNDPHLIALSDAINKASDATW